jgi:hypothetical protein
MARLDGLIATNVTASIIRETPTDDALPAARTTEMGVSVIHLPPMLPVLARTIGVTAASARAWRSQDSAPVSVRQITTSTILLTAGITA